MNCHKLTINYYLFLSRQAPKIVLMIFAPGMYSNGEIVAMDRAYINYEKFEELTERNVVYVIKLKRNLVCEFVNI